MIFLSLFRHLIKPRPKAQAKRFSAEDFAWEMEGLFPEADSQTMLWGNEARVIAIEWTRTATRDKKQEERHATIYFADGASKIFPAEKWNLAQFAQTKKEKKWAKEFDDWLACKNVAFAAKPDGDWGCARRKEKALGPLQHPEVFHQFVIFGHNFGNAFPDEKLAPWMEKLAVKMAREFRANLSPAAEISLAHVVDRPQARAERVKTLQEQLPERLRSQVEARISKEDTSRQSNAMGES